MASTVSERIKRRRAFLMEAQFGACCLCNKSMQSFDYTQDDYHSMEHLVPRRSKSLKKHRRCNSPFILLSHCKCNADRKRDPVPVDLILLANALTREFVEQERAAGFVYDLAPATDLPMTYRSEAA